MPPIIAMVNSDMKINDCVTLDHGSGGLAARELVQEVFLSRLNNPFLAPLEDSAVLPVVAGRLAFTTDSYVVDPLFFPGGDIGALAINGTVNDLAMRGAVPLGLSLGLIIEEGLPLEVLERVADSIALAANTAGVQVVTGDTKVVHRGAADKLFINTSGVGSIVAGIEVSPRQVQVGDGIILSGTMADHGITVCEIAMASGTSMEIREEDIPLNRPVSVACELLGIDPFFLANEGKCLLFVDPAVEFEVIAKLRRHSEGERASLIGRVAGNEAGRIVLHTAVGGQRLMTPLTGDPLPRIC